MSKIDFEELEIDLEPYKKELKEMYSFLSEEEVWFLVEVLYNLCKNI